jgi:hypothetical protein
LCAQVLFTLEEQFFPLIALDIKGSTNMVSLNKNFCLRILYSASFLSIALVLLYPMVVYDSLETSSNQENGDVLPLTDITLLLLNDTFNDEFGNDTR